MSIGTLYEYKYDIQILVSIALTVPSLVFTSCCCCCWLSCSWLSACGAIANDDNVLMLGLLTGEVVGLDDPGAALLLFFIVVICWCYFEVDGLTAVYYIYYLVLLI